MNVYSFRLSKHRVQSECHHLFFPHWNKTKDDIKEKVEIYENETGIIITKLNDGEYLTINY